MKCNPEHNLNDVLARVPSDKREIAESITKELEFMTETLDELKAEIRKYGCVTEYKNGKQEFLRENPAAKTYGTLVQRYSSLYKQLTDLMPKSSALPEEDELMEFIRDE